MNDPSRTFFPPAFTAQALPSPPASPTTIDVELARPSTPSPPAAPETTPMTSGPLAHELPLPPSPSSSTFDDTDNLARSTPLPLSPPTSPKSQQSEQHTNSFTPAANLSEVVPVTQEASRSREEAVPLTAPPPPAPAPPAGSVQLPPSAVDAPSLGAGVPKTLQKKKSLLGFNRSSSSSKDRSAAGTTSGSADKPESTAKKSSLMGGLIRTLTGRSHSKPKPTKLDGYGQPASVVSGKGSGLGSVLEDKSEKERLKHLETIQTAKLNDHVATLLVPSNRQARPLSNSFTSPSSLAATANGGGAPPTSPSRNPNAPPTDPASPPPIGPNHLRSINTPRIVSQPPPGRPYPVAPPQFTSSHSYNSGQQKPKLAVSVPASSQFTSRASPLRGPTSGASPIPINNHRSSPKQQTGPVTPAATYAPHHSSSSGGSCSDSDDHSSSDEAAGLTIRKRRNRVSHHQQPTPIDEDDQGSNISHSISPTTPGLPMTPPDSAISPTSPSERAHPFFGSVGGGGRGRNGLGAGGGGGGGGRPLSMHFHTAGGGNKQEHYQTVSQSQQKQMNRQSRIPAAPQMHTAAEVAAKIAESGKDEEVFFM